ncbi:hypothetical protein WJX81_006431 [Elliptochloris bilobata]|uniref:Glycosyltransferase n=1 Tax=Elliptochloris bilobata TaxID=381761 RepID=A0AAW1S1J5_9CHLO
MPGASTALSSRTLRACARRKHVVRCFCTAADSRSVLFLARVWPEPSSSAAGVRSYALATAFAGWGWDVSYLSSARRNAHADSLAAEGCRVFCCPINREAELAAVLAEAQPHVCIFDRMESEETFSFRVHELAPTALRVLDMQDMVALRRGRQAVVEAGGSVAEALAHVPTAEYNILQRELAAIHRSDLTLVCSPVEMALLQGRYGVPADKLCLAPFFMRPGHQPSPVFAARRHFMSIGNWKHAPNMDAAAWACREIWPQIRDAGKIVDAWAHGLPVVTTPIGAEGMHLDGSAAEPQAAAHSAWGGLWASCDADGLAADAARLYTDPALWNACAAGGARVLLRLYDAGTRLGAVRAAVEGALAKLRERRAHDYYGSLLWQQSARATEFFARWLELKENRAAASQGDKIM